MPQSKERHEKTNHSENPYIDYPNKPIVLGSTKEAIQHGVVEWLHPQHDLIAHLDSTHTTIELPSNNLETPEEDLLYITVPNKHLPQYCVVNLPSGEKRVIPPENQLDKIPATIDGLARNLTPGSTYEADYNQFSKEYEDAMIASFEEGTPIQAGEVAYYPRGNKLTWYAPRNLRQLAWLARNELQLNTPNLTLTWEEQRKVFNPLTIGIIGGSVGSTIFKRLIDLLRLSWMKIADHDIFDDSNRNRSQFGYESLMENKAETLALDAHDTDPSLPISVYSDGIRPANIQDFLLGNSDIGEPRLDCAVEVCDNPDVKIKTGQECRENGINLFRLTDFGASFQVDFYPYKDHPDFPLAIGVSDQKLFDSKDDFEGDPSNRDFFFEFAFAQVGWNWELDKNFAAFINEENNTPFTKGIPQLPIATEAGASQVALTIALSLLGHDQPHRLYVNTKDGYIVKENLIKADQGWTVLEKTTHDLSTGSVIKEVVDLDTKQVVESTQTDIHGVITIRQYDYSRNQVEIITIDAINNTSATKFESIHQN